MPLQAGMKRANKVGVKLRREARGSSSTIMSSTRYLDQINLYLTSLEN